MRVIKIWLLFGRVLRRWFDDRDVSIIVMSGDE